MDRGHPLFSSSSPLKETLQETKAVCFGIFLYTGEALFAEAAAVAGADFVVIDMEASPMSGRDALSVMQVLSGSSCSSVVRVPRHDSHLVAHALDLGADGVMVPKVETGNEARLMGAACRYPPEGTRGLNALRASAYGQNEPAYLASANSKSLCVVQIESPSAVRAVDDITAAPTVDVIFVGTGDLALSLGVPGDHDHEKVADARRRVLRSYIKAGKIPGIFAPSVHHAERFAEQGFRLIAVGNEVKWFMAGLGATLGALDAYREKAA